MVALSQDGSAGGLRIEDSMTVTPNGRVEVSYEHYDRYHLGFAGLASINDPSRVVEVADGLFFVEGEEVITVAPVFKVNAGLLLPDAMLTR